MCFIPRIAAACGGTPCQSPSVSTTSCAGNAPRDCVRVWTGWSPCSASQCGVLGESKSHGVLV